MADGTYYPKTGSVGIERGIANQTEEARTSTGLSTQIIVKVNEQAVGALQSLEINQQRPLARVNAVGHDGHIEIVPQGSTTFDLTVNRVVFDALRLPEAFSRAFRFIDAQRIPFDIDIYDLNTANSTTAISEYNRDSGVVVMSFINCWFQSYRTPYQADNYLITESATIYAETGRVTSGVSPITSIRNLEAQTDAAEIEKAVNGGLGRGGMDAPGILNALFNV